MLLIQRLSKIFYCWLCCFLALFPIYTYSQKGTIVLGEPDRVFTKKDGLIDNSMYGCIQDKKGFIWIYTEKGVSKYDGHRFKNYTIKDGLPTNSIWLMTVDPLNRIWLHSHDKGLYYIENDQVIKVLEHPRVQPFIYLNMEQNGNLRFYTQDSVFMLQKAEKNSYSFIPPVYNPKNVICELDGWNFALNKSNQDSISIFNESKNKKYFLVAHSKERFRTPIVDQKRVFISSTNGLYIFHNDTIQLHYKFGNNNYINRCYIDRDSNLWVTTANFGLLFFSKNHSALRQINHDSLFRLTRNIPSSHSLYFLDNNDHVYSFDVKNHQFERLYKFPGIQVIKKFIQGFSLIFTDALIYVFRDNHEKKIIPYLDFIRKEYPQLDKNSSTRNFVLIGKDSFIQINPVHACQLVVWKDTGLIIKVVHKDKNRLQRLYCDSKKNIFIFNSDSIHRYNQHFINKNSISNKKVKSISAIAEDSTTSTLYLGTFGQGLFKLSEQKLTQLLDNISINKIELYKKYLIISNENGIFIYTKNSKDSLIYVNSYTSKDGIPPDGLLNFSINQDTICAILENGIILYPLSFNSGKKDNLHFYSFQVDNYNVLHSNKIVIPADHKQLNIEFSLFNYSYVDEVKYEYLLNASTTWIPIETNQIIFERMKPGIYQLRVKAINKHTLEVMSSSSISFTVKSPWWKQSWFLLLSNILLLASLFWMYKKWIQRRVKRESYIAGLETHLRELKLNALESQMNPHFIYNSLGSIQYFIQNNKKDQAEYYLTRFAKLVRSFLEASRKQMISVEEEVELLEKYLSLEKMRYEDKFSFKIEIDSGINQSETKIHSMFLQPFVENSIQHGLFHREKDGLLTIKFLRENDDLIVVITDNGIGIKKSEELKNGNQQPKLSRAMQIFTEKMEIINKINPGAIEYTSSELYHDNEKFKGNITTLIFKNVCK